MTEFQLRMEELKEAEAAEWAHPLPCSGAQAYQRAVRVTLARRSVGQDKVLAATNQCQLDNRQMSWLSCLPVA